MVVSEWLLTTVPMTSSVNVSTVPRESAWDVHSWNTCTPSRNRHQSPWMEDGLITVNGASAQRLVDLVSKYERGLAQILSPKELVRSAKGRQLKRKLAK